MAKTGLALFLGVVLTFALAGCRSDTNEPSATDYARTLQKNISTDAVMAHLQKLQDIANANGGTRVAGSPGFDATVDYVVNTLKDKGFDVQTPEFTARMFQVDAESLTVNGTPLTAWAVDFSGASPPGGVTAPLVATPAAHPTGCRASDYGGAQVAGAIALVDRGDCELIDKVKAATDRGAVGLVIADNRDEKTLLTSFWEQQHVKLPVVWVSQADGAKLRAQPGTAKVVVEAGTRDVKVRNVIAQTKTGSTENVVMVGAHLDSVRYGPGINDDGTGIATLLETALQLGDTPPVKNAVRFGFWGAEEEGLLGSKAYAKTLDVERLKNIALYLNFDMLASPNAGYFSLDGNLSTRPDPDMGMQIIPEGSAGIDRALAACLKGAGKQPEDGSFDGRSDYDSFSRTGIPVGGLDTGAEVAMTDKEAALWGGQTGKAFDPNYHSADDTFANINRDALSVTAPCVGYLSGLYAQDQSGHNGVPNREDRTRLPVEQS
jgi:Zn-dependent M28 family amino/carboxypeptidase